MTKGPNRLTLDRYLDSAQEGTLSGSGRDWKRKAEALQKLADAIKVSAQQAELRIGEQTLTGPALRKGMEESATSMTDKSEQLRAAGEALVQVGTQISDTKDARDSMKPLGDKPAAYQPPAGTGVPFTPEELEAQAAASQARQSEQNSWQDAYDKQEARSLALTRQMDSAFLGAIPPMKAIHGQDDPTEPTPSVPSGPGGPLLPGTQVPSGGNGKPQYTAVVTGGNDDGKDDDDPVPTANPPTPEVITCGPWPVRPEQETGVPTGPTVPEGPSTSVGGSSQTGVTYQPTGGQVSTPVSGSSGTSGISPGGAIGAAGMSGTAGALSAGAVRGGSVPASPGRSASSPVRSIGSTGRSGSASALSRSATPGSAGAAGRSASGAAGARGGAAGSTAGRSGAGGRSGAAGARGGATGAGSRSGGSRGAAGSAAGGRGGRKGDRDTTTDRDSLVYDQDWLGDDEVAPGVLD